MALWSPAQFSMLIILLLMGAASSTETTSQITDSIQETQTPAAPVNSDISEKTIHATSSPPAEAAPVNSDILEKTIHATSNPPTAVAPLKTTHSSEMTTHATSNPPTAASSTETTSQITDSIQETQTPASSTETTSQITDSIRETQTPGFPGIPRDLRVEPHSTTVRVTFDPPGEDSGIPVLGYWLEWRQNSSQEWNRIRIDNEYYLVTGLQPNTLYQLRVSAINGRGDGNYSDIVFTRTLSSREKAQSGNRTGTVIIISVITVLLILLAIILLVGRCRGDSADAGNPEKPAQTAGGTQQRNQNSTSF